MAMFVKNPEADSSYAHHGRRHGKVRAIAPTGPRVDAFNGSKLLS
jgi:hypothetical protein